MNYEFDKLDLVLIKKYRKAVEYLENGDPLKDVLEQEDIEAAIRLIVEVADHAMGKKPS